MNLSKIATGIVASFCLVSSVTSASNLSYNDKLVERLLKVSGKNKDEAKAIRELLEKDGIVLVDEEDIFQYTSKPDYSAVALLNDELNKEVNNLEFKVNANKASISKNKYDISDIKDSVSDHFEMIQGNTELMADLKDDIFENAESIARNKNNILNLILIIS
ncbi:TPA: hypothetical protein ACU16Q_000823 [Pasteurella multocida]|uniref:hypothetical protein n=1 Tax=Pasteurella multocida TaxID=747 RepID=UPI00189A0935|nr:hypothetical protein [Pasteurella multocida]MBF6982585.1 hypothetical protein [Pasteurella multocida]